MDYKKHTQLSGFTLVELVVVATILVILSAIGFSAYTSYIDGARDTNRIVELSNIRSGLQSVATKGSLPLPTDSVTINNGVEILGYQGYAGADVLENIDLKKGGKDPLDDTYYSYYLTKSRNHFQLLGFLENESTAYSALPMKETRAFDFDYSLRYPTVTGESLGIMVGTGAYTNIPIQELEEVTTSGILDVSTTLVEYTAIIKDDYTISGNNTALSVVASLGKTGGYLGSSCKDTIDNNPSLLGKDGVYSVKPQEDVIEVFCDMSFNGGGWTFVMFYNNDSYATEDYFEEFIGDYSLTREDTDTAYSIPTNIFSHTEMMATLETPNPTIAESHNDIVFYEYDEGNTFFNNGPVTCVTGDSFSYKLSVNDSYTSGGTLRYCTSNSWYSRKSPPVDSSSGYLLLFSRTASVGGVFRGLGIGTSTASPITGNGWGKNGWFYIR